MQEHDLTGHQARGKKLHATIREQPSLANFAPSNLGWQSESPSTCALTAPSLGDFLHSVSI